MQLADADEFAGQKVPFAHGLGAVDDAGQKLPAGHATSDKGVAQKLPAAHGVADADDSGQNVPAAHVVIIPPAHHEPAGHVGTGVRTRSRLLEESVT